MKTVTRARYGEMECLKEDSVISRSLVLYGEWAQLELDLLAHLIQPGDVVLDIGAYLGSHTLAFAQMVGPSGIVHSFEPHAAIVALLKSNVQRNALDQVHVHPYAVGIDHLQVDVPQLAIDTIQNFGGVAVDADAREMAASPAGTERVVIVPLDGLQFDRIDFIKIDAEGMEPSIIQGATKTISRHRPLIFAECNDLEKGGRLLHALSAMNFSAFGVLSAAFNVRNYKGHNVNIFADATEASLLAIPNEKIDELLAVVGGETLVPIDSIDALNLLLLHKPQYAGEVLAKSSAARVLNLDFPSPLSRRMKDLADEFKLAFDAEQSLASQRSIQEAEAAAAYQSVARELEAVRVELARLDQAKQAAEQIVESCRAQQQQLIRRASEVEEAKALAESLAVARLHELVQADARLRDAEQVVASCRAESQQLIQRICEVEEAKAFAESLAVARLHELMQVGSQLTATETAKEQAEELAYRHLQSLREMHDQLLATAHAKEVAERLVASLQEQAHALLEAPDAMRNRASGAVQRNMEEPPGSAMEVKK